MIPDSPRSQQVNPDISGHRELPPVDSFEANNPSVPGQTDSPVVKVHKDHTPIVPIIIAVLVALVLIAAATAVYISTRKTSTPEPEAPTVSEVEKGKVAPEDLDATNASIDQSLNTTNDSTDFRTEDLLDSTLGL